MSASGYAKVKGRSERAAPAPVDLAPAATNPAPPLSDEERAAIAQRKADCERYAPEFAAFLRECYALGMIEGWRALERVEIKAVEINAAPSGAPKEHAP